MSPAQTSLISSRLLACIFRSRPMRSRASLVELKTPEPGVEVARVDAEERELADEGVGHDLEDQGRERRVVGRPAARARRRRRRGPSIGGHVEGRRQVVDDGVEQLLDALVLEGRAAEDGLDVAGDRGAAQRRLDLLGLDLAAVEVLLEQRVVGLGDRLDQHLAVLRRPRPACPPGSRATSNVAPSASSWKSIAFIATRSMMPRWFASVPQGIWIGAGLRVELRSSSSRRSAGSSRRRGPSC